MPPTSRQKANWPTSGATKQPIVEARNAIADSIMVRRRPMVAATIGVFAATQEYKSLSRALSISCVTAAAGTAIPYLCLRSFRIAAETQFRWELVGASAVVAFLIFLLVLVLDVGVHRSRRRSSWSRIGTSAAVGAAIVLWSLGALHAVRFRPVTAEGEVAHTFARSFAVLAGIAGATMLMISGTILITTLSRLFSMREELFAKAHERESFFNNLAEAIPGIVWIADDKGQTTYINRHWYELTGADPHQSLGSGWME